MTIFVLGSVNEDIQLDVDHVVLPAETLLVTERGRQTGGKGANQAVAAATLFPQVELIGAVGSDAAGKAALAYLDEQGVGTGNVTIAGAPTGTATIQITPAGQNAILVSPGANAHLNSSAVESALTGISDVDALVTQLEIPLESVRTGLIAARAAGALTVLNASPAQTLPRTVLELVDVLVVNELEGATLTGHEPSAAGSRTELESLSALGPRNVVQTLGADGAAYLDEKGEYGVLPADEVDVVDTTGAGDAFLGALVASLLSSRPGEGDALRRACRTGVATASRCVGMTGPLRA